MRAHFETNMFIIYRERQTDRQSASHANKAHLRERERETQFGTNECLLYKLIESGIGGKTYDLIKSMYTESKCCIKNQHQTYKVSFPEAWSETGLLLKPNII